MKNKKIISSLVAAVLCAQSMALVPFTVSAAVAVPQDVTTTIALEDSMDIPSDDAGAGDITSISLGGAYKGSYEIKFNMSVSGELSVDTPDKGAANDTYITFNAGKVGPYIISSGYNAAKNTMTFTWQTTSNGGTFDVVIGKEYAISIVVENGSMDGGVGKLTVTPVDGGDPVVLENLNLRNYSSAKDSSGAGVSQLQVVNLAKDPMANITISNVSVVSATPDSIEVSLTQPVMGSTKGETKITSLNAEENIIEVDSFEDSEISYSVEPMLNGAVTTAYTTPFTVDLKSQEKGFELDKTNSKLIVKKNLPVGEYDLVISAQVAGYDQTKIECPVKLVKKEATVDEVSEAFGKCLNISSNASYLSWNPDTATQDQLQFSISDIYEDIVLPSEWGSYDITWESSDEAVVSTTGKVMPKAEDTAVKLTAKIDVNGTEVSKDFDVIVKGAKKGTETALNCITMQTKDLIRVDAENVKEDFKISAPTYKSTLNSVKKSDGTYETKDNGYRGDYIKFSYEEDKGIIVVDENGNAVLYPTAEGNDDVVLKVTAEYIKDGVKVEDATVTKEYNLKVTASFDSAIKNVLDGTVVTNADTGLAADLSDVSYDLVLPTNIGGVEFKNWKITNDLFTVSKDGKKATICGKKIGSETGTISADVVYKKGDTVLYEGTYEKEITGVLSEDMADKYCVRCDAAASANFKNCPEDEEKVTSKIDLPTKGIFGSKISWSSSVPTAISNTGKVTKQKTSKKVTLTATITKGSAPSESYVIKNLVVPSSSGSTGGSGGGSGSSSNTNSTVSSTNNRANDTSYKGGLMPNTSLEKGDITTATVVSFSDLNGAAWAKDAITALYNKGVINGKSASTFAPNDDITRAEFAKIIVKAFELEDTAANVSNFSDVKAGDWYYTAVASAYNKGIIKGYEDGTFGVNDKITRQDMAVIIYRAAQAANKTIAPVKDGVSFDDNADIASYAAEAVTALQKGGVINGMTATTFAPKSTATRAQAAQMIYGIVK